jgi:hypothetical protein
VAVFEDNVKTISGHITGTGTLGGTLLARRRLTGAILGEGLLTGNLTGGDDEPETPTSSTLKLELREGSTLRAVRYIVPTVLGPGESPRWELVLTATERAAVTNWNNAEIWLSAEGGTRAIRVHRVRLISP